MQRLQTVEMTSAQSDIQLENGSREQLTHATLMGQLVCVVTAPASSVLT